MWQWSRNKIKEGQVVLYSNTRIWGMGGGQPPVPIPAHMHWYSEPFRLYDDD